MRHLNRSDCENGAVMQRRTILLVVGMLALLVAGGASAIALRTIYVRPGHCRTVKGVRVCARKVRPRTVIRTVPSTVTRTVTRTVTVAPSPIGKTFSGNGSKTLAPLTLAHGVNVRWTAKPDSYGWNMFSVSGSSSDDWVSFDNGNKTTSGTSYIPPGTFTFDVTASAAWTLSF